MKALFLTILSAAAICTPLAQAQTSDQPTYPEEFAAYSFYVSPSNVETASYWMPCYHPDPGNELNYRIAEYWNNKQNGFKGTLLWEWGKVGVTYRWNEWIRSGLDLAAAKAWCGNPIINGITETGLSSTKGNSLEYMMTVSKDASKLSFRISGGTGDADLYVSRITRPTDSQYLCRPFTSTNNETCSLDPFPGEGNYYIRVKAYKTFSGVSLLGNYEFTKTPNLSISDHSTITSPVIVDYIPGKAPTDLKVTVDIRHTYIGDLKVDLIAPDNTVHVLHNRTGGSTDNILRTYFVDASKTNVRGTWRLRVDDNANGDTGTFSSWSLNFVQ